MIEGQPGRPPDIDELDRARLLEALTLARTSFGLTEPNPRVGCVLADQSGRLIGVGATQAAGSAHAEVMALRDAGANFATNFTRLPAIQAWLQEKGVQTVAVTP